MRLRIMEPWAKISEVNKMEGPGFERTVVKDRLDCSARSG